jgi:hypothetical protein
MKAFLKKHTEGILTASAIFLIGVTAWCFIWGMVFLSQSLDTIFASPTGGPGTVSFNLMGAQSLDLKGLMVP